MLVTHHNIPRHSLYSTRPSIRSSVGRSHCFFSGSGRMPSASNLLRASSRAHVETLRLIQSARCIPQAIASNGLPEALDRFKSLGVASTPPATSVSHLDRPTRTNTRTKDIPEEEDSRRVRLESKRNARGDQAPGKDVHRPLPSLRLGLLAGLDAPEPAGRRVELALVAVAAALPAGREGERSCSGRGGGCRRRGAGAAPHRAGGLSEEGHRVYRRGGESMKNDPVVFVSDVSGLPDPQLDCAAKSWSRAWSLIA